MSDAAGGRGMEDILNYLLSEVTWGTVSKEKWIISENGELNYKRFIDQQFPYIQDGQPVPDGHGSAAAFNKTQKKFRKGLHGTFTNQDQPGHSVRPLLMRLLSKMTMQTEVQREAAAELATTVLEPGLLADTWKRGRHFLLPSFLHLLCKIQSDETLMKKVRIVYRTFGTDLPYVKQELDIMAQGKHPLFPGFELDSRLTLRAPFSTFYRRGSEQNDCFLTHGTLQRPDGIRSNDAQVQTFYTALLEETQTFKGFDNILTALQSMVETEPRQCVGIRDHYDYWAANGESDDSGKILLVDNGSTKVRNIFVDDHVESNHAHIVDVRRVSDGSRVPFDEAIGSCMLRALPYDAIMNDDYFINVIQAVLSQDRCGAKY